MAQTVLLVDDDPLTHQVLQRYLERAGYQMIGARNGREALKLARRQLPQLIILDVMMPDMDGWAVLGQLKRTEATQAIPVILLTMKADPSAQEQAEQAAATLLLAKPISAAQLLAVIKRVIPAPAGDNTSGKTRT
jgi:CheY-like chemotaxis protein